MEHPRLSLAFLPCESLAAMELLTWTCPEAQEWSQDGWWLRAGIVLGGHSRSPLERVCPAVIDINKNLVV